MFLSVIGPKAYKLISSLVTPSKSEDKPYEELVKKMEDHHCPAPLEIVQRYKFHTRVRGPKESIANYVAELKSAATDVQIRR